MQTISPQSRKIVKIVENRLKLSVKGFRYTETTAIDCVGQKMPQKGIRQIFRGESMGEAVPGLLKNCKLIRRTSNNRAKFVIFDPPIRLLGRKDREGGGRRACKTNGCLEVVHAQRCRRNHAT